MDNNNRANRSEAEEFNAFNATSSAPAGDAQRPQRRPATAKQKAPKAKKGFNISKKFIIAAIIGVLVLLLVVGIVVVALTRDRHIMKKDNAYLVYTDSSGYHLLSNGREIENDFQGEVKIEVAKDNSFAYVFDEVEDKVYVYLLKGKKLEPLTDSGVDEVLAWADLKPGIVYRKNSAYRLYSEKHGTETIVKKEADNFLLSGDASTVVYTTPNKDIADVNKLVVFQDGDNTTLNAKNNCVPEAVSNYGDYIYASFLNDGIKKLSVFTTKDLDNPEGEVIVDSEGFVGILDMNVKGNELLIYTALDTTVEDPETKIPVPTVKSSTKLYRYSKKGEHVAVKLADLAMIPMKTDPDIVCFDDFADVYLSGMRMDNPTLRAVYYLDKDYESSSIAKYTMSADLDTWNDPCTIDQDGKYLYYINEDKELIQMDLKSKTKETNDLGFGVIEFYLTQKGNVYYLDEYGELFFREKKETRTNSIAEEVSDISFYRYSNTLFFTKEEGESIFSTKEGSDEDVVKMDGAQISALPEFYNTNSKQSYAAYYDANNGGMLFYTSNGKKFKKITNDCLTINGDELADNIADVIPPTNNDEQ